MGGVQHRANTVLRRPRCRLGIAGPGRNRKATASIELVEDVLAVEVLHPGGEFGALLAVEVDQGELAPQQVRHVGEPKPLVVDEHPRRVLAKLGVILERPTNPVGIITEPELVLATVDLNPFAAGGHVGPRQRGRTTLRHEQSQRPQVTAGSIDRDVPHRVSQQHGVVGVDEPGRIALDGVVVGRDSSAPTGLTDPGVGLADLGRQRRVHGLEIDGHQRGRRLQLIPVPPRHEQEAAVGGDRQTGGLAQRASIGVRLGTTTTPPDRQQSQPGARADRPMHASTV